MHRFRRRLWHAFIATGLILPLGGCITADGLLLALTRDISLTSAAATQGLLAGWLTSIGLR